MCIVIFAYTTFVSERKEGKQSWQTPKLLFSVSLNQLSAPVME